MKKLIRVVGIIFFVLAVVGCIAVEAYVWLTYADMTASELPAWVLFFMFGQR